MLLEVYQGQKKNEERGNEVVSTNNQLKLMKTKQNFGFQRQPCRRPLPSGEA